MASKAAEPGGGTTWGSVRSRLQKELMMSGDHGISAFPELDNLIYEKNTSMNPTKNI
uniref:Uncharacterized protein n=1 Tax=Pseudonaja textilis TaxID=8673 RepID=A0A670ZVJ5_PSETE